jgi:hypothetical protein
MFKRWLWATPGRWPSVPSRQQEVTSTKVAFQHGMAINGMKGGE